LVSTVSGRLRAGFGWCDVLAATFPPGSVTGAPKLRAMDVIALVEGAPRGAYTGAIGFSSPTWGAEFNVAIRTFEIADGRVALGVGGGITADSVPMLEWQECLHKAVPLLTAVGGRTADAVTVTRDEPAPTAEQLAGGILETVLVVDGRPLRLEDHLARLDRSCRELYRHELPSDVAPGARRACATAGAGRAVLRVVSTRDGVRITCTRAADRPATSVARTITGRPGLWRHKWADRAYLSEVEAAAGGAVPVFVADDGSVLETSRGNVFVMTPGGTLVTPPLRDDLLPGVTRRALLDLAHDTGRSVELRAPSVDELVAGTPFWTSSLSLAVPILAVDGMPTGADEELVRGFAAALAGGDATIR
jgi:para-aminobenzoate synthetase/4-amino-4-deoxychorismate lyase